VGLHPILGSRGNRRRDRYLNLCIAWCYVNDRVSLLQENDRRRMMELSYAELFLLTWSLASSVYAIMLRERHRKFVFAGTIALSAIKEVIENVADEKVTLKRVGNKIEVVKFKTGE